MSFIERSLTHHVSRERQVLDDVLLGGSRGVRLEGEPQLGLVHPRHRLLVVARDVRLAPELEAVARRQLDPGRADALDVPRGHVVRVELVRFLETEERVRRAREVLLVREAQLFLPGRDVRYDDLSQQQK